MRRALKQNAIFLTVMFCGTALLVGVLWLQFNHRLQAERSAVVNAAVQRNTNLVVALEQYAVRTISNADAVLQLVKTEYQHRGENLDFAALLNSFTLDQDAFAAVAVCNERGDVVAASTPLSGHTVNVRDRGYFRWQQGQTTDSLYIGRPLLSRLTRQVVIPLCRRLQKKDGSFAGVVLVQIKPATFTRFYGDATLRPHDLISLVGTDDAVTLSRRTGNVESHSEYIGKSPLFGYLKKSPVNSYFAKDALHGIPTYFSYRKLKQYALVATVGTVEADVLADFYRQATTERDATIVISVLVVLLSLLFAAGLLHRKRSVRLIEASEERYRSIFEHSSDAILLLRADYSIAAANKAACVLLGYTPDELKPAAQAILPDSIIIQAISRIHDGTIAEPQAPPELQFVRKNGQRITGELASTRFTQSDGSPGYIVIIRDRTERLRLQKKLALEQKRHQRQLTEQVIQAQERERETIGRELHDNVNQVLTTVKLYLEMAIANKDMRDDLLPKSMQYVSNSITEIRNLSRELSAPTLGTKSLIDSLSALVETIQGPSGLAIKFEHQTYSQTIGMDQKLALYRIVQEQLNNIIKHAEARQVTIVLKQTPDATVLRVCDDGKGFDAAVRHNGIGLNNILGRARILDGDVQVETAPGKGCCITVSLPLSTSAQTVEGVTSGQTLER